MSDFEASPALNPSKLCLIYSLHTSEQNRTTSLFVWICPPSGNHGVANPLGFRLLDSSPSLSLSLSLPPILLTHDHLTLCPSHSLRLKKRPPSRETLTLSNTAPYPRRLDIPLKLLSSFPLPLSVLPASIQFNPSLLLIFRCQRSPIGDRSSRQHQQPLTH